MLLLTSVRPAEYGVPEGGRPAEPRLAQNGQFGESWNCRLEAVGAFVVALAARRFWFCYHRLFAVLLRCGRRRTGAG